MYYVYIILCKDKSLYTGITTDVSRRLSEHIKGLGGHYTRSHGAVEVVYKERKKNRSTASKREAQIKKLSRQQKQELIRGV